MSTTIYNGYIIKKCTLRNLLNRRDALREEIEKSVSRDITRISVEEAVLLFDKHSLGFNLNIEKRYKENPVLIYTKFKNRQEYLKEEHMYPDYRCEFSIYPFKNGFLVLYYGNSSYEEIFKEIMKAEDYYYQDQSDKPKEIDEKEWGDRKKNWNKVFKLNPIPSLSCLNARCHPIYPIFGDRLEVMRFIPSLEERAEKIVIDKILLGKRLVKDENGLIENLPEGGIIKTFNYLTRDPEGKKKVREMSDQISEGLKPGITWEDLTRENIL